MRIGYNAINHIIIDYVVGIESRGFIFGGMLALALNAGFVPIRKAGKLPHKTYQQPYNLEYGTDILEIHQDAFEKGANVLLVDDVLATGGTLAAAIALTQQAGGKCVEATCLIELEALKGRDLLASPFYSVVRC